MKFGIVVFPGSNCDIDVKYVIEEVFGCEADYIWHKETSLQKYHCLVLPGGFSYGDYLREGAIARFSPVMDQVVKFADEGGLVLGICNGFQILLEVGLLPGAMKKNDSLQFRCHDTCLKVENENTPFTSNCREGEVLKMPIAHSAGNYHIDEESLEELKVSGQIVLRYSDADGIVKPEANPNGSLDNIGAICNRERNVFAVMPHPERCCEELLGGTDGSRIFSSVIDWCKRGEKE